ncbi:MAG: hypothetical protein L0220_27890, partial [Acidobacteria bacterium]|nr:hypothetical protein [Acidobacteriota bacterium]
RRSAYCCAVCAPTGIVRKECYSRFGGFPLNLPRAGDYYLWAIFATMYDVGYFAEPMVYYRQHTINMEKKLQEEQPAVFYEQELLIRWVVKKEAESSGIYDLSSDFYRSLVDLYLLRLVKTEVENWPHGRTWETATKEIRDNASSEKEAEEILRLIRTAWPGALANRYSFVGSGYYQIGELDKAVTAFRSALRSNPWSIKPRIFLWASILEQLFGIRLGRLVPFIKMLKNALL